MEGYSIPGLRVCLVREPGVELPEWMGLDVSNWKAVAEVVSKYLGGADREHFVILLLDARNKVVGINTVSIGSLTGNLVHPRELFKPAILAGAASIILSHNHPSGDPEPSGDDISLTRRMVAAGAILGIDVLDHVVVGDRERYVSFKQRGMI